MKHQKRTLCACFKFSIAWASVRWVNKPPGLNINSEVLSVNLTLLTRTKASKADWASSGSWTLVLYSCHFLIDVTMVERNSEYLETRSCDLDFLVFLVGFEAHAAKSPLELSLEAFLVSEVPIMEPCEDDCCVGLYLWFPDEESSLCCFAAEGVSG